MRRVTFALLALAALCTGCGDDAPDQRKGGEALTPEEMAARIRASGRSGEDTAKALEAALKQAQEQMGGENPMEVAAKARAMSARPLTSADVETWLVVAPKARPVMGKPVELRAVLNANGLTAAEWMVLNGRVMASVFALRVPKENVDAKIAPDVEVVRPFEARIQAAMKGK